MACPPQPASSPPPRPLAPEPLHRAIVDLVDEHGYERTTVEMVLDRAGVDRAEFDRCFAGMEDACIQTYDRIAAGVGRRVFGAYEAQENWREGLRAAAYEITRFFRDNPRDGRFGAYEVMKATDMAQARRESTLQLYAGMIDAGCQELDDPDSVSRSTAEAVMGSIIGVLVKRIPSEGLDHAPDWVPELMYIAVRPYLGPETAAEELSIPPPPQQGEEGG